MYANRDEDICVHKTAGSHPTFRLSKPTKVLFTPDHSGGWVTNVLLGWGRAQESRNDAFLAWMLTYQPLIEALESRGQGSTLGPILTMFRQEAKAKLGVEIFASGHDCGLAVLEVKCRDFEIHEYDGKEPVVDVSTRRFVDV